MGLFWYGTVLTWDCFGLGLFWFGTVLAGLFRWDCFGLGLFHTVADSLYKSSFVFSSEFQMGTKPIKH